MPRVRLLVGALALVLPTTTAVTRGAALADEPIGGTYNALRSTRVLDTGTGFGGRSTPLAVYETHTVPMAGVAGVPMSGAAAVAIDITVVDAPGKGHMIVFPSATTRPGTSTINTTAGQTISNFAVVPLGSDGAISVYNSVPDGPSNIRIDVHGWISALTDTSAPGRYVPLTQQRIIDTRTGTGGRSTQLGAGEVWTINLAGRGGIPSTAASAAINATVPTPASEGSLKIYTAGTTRPTAATLDYVTGTPTATFTMPTLSSAGEVSIFNSGPAAIHVVIDSMGYLTGGTGATTRGGMMEFVTPSRIVDTRDGTGGRTGRLAAYETAAMQIRGAGGIPTDPAVSGSAILMVTAAHALASGHFTVWPTGATRPATTTVNFAYGVTRAGFVIVPIGSDGKIQIYNNAADGTHLLVDVIGYVTPTNQNRAPNAPSGLAPSGGVAVPEATPLLSAAVSDADVDRMTTSWSLRADATGVVLLNNVPGADVASGSTAAYRVPFAKLENKKSYSWQMTACDGTACTTSAWASFSTDGMNPLPVRPTEPGPDPNECYDGFEVDPTEVACYGQATAEDGPLAAGPAVDYWAYSGDEFSATPSNDVVVLEQTVNTSTTGTWNATGLTRNELFQAGTSGVTVTARLMSATGSQVGTASSTTPQYNIRPGEPLPFTVAAPVPASAVASVEWTASPTAVTPPAERALSAQILQTSAYSATRERELLDYGYYREDATATTPLPHVEYGVAVNDGPSTVTAPRLVGAWVDAVGRVVATADVPITDEAGAPVSLAPTEVGVFLVIVSDPVIAPQIANASFVTWTVAA